MNSGSKSCPEARLHFFFSSTMPTVLMKKHPRLPQLPQRELALQPSPSQAEKTRAHRTRLAMGADSFASKCLLPNFAYEGCGFAARLRIGGLHLTVSRGAYSF